MASQESRSGRTRDMALAKGYALALEFPEWQVTVPALLQVKGISHWFVTIPRGTALPEHLTAGHPVKVSFGWADALYFFHSVVERVVEGGEVALMIPTHETCERAQRRLHARVPADLKVRYWVSDDAEPLTTHTVNVSAGGCLLCANNLTVGQEIELEVHLPREHHPPKVFGKVVRATIAEVGGEPAPAVGIEFQGLSEPESDRFAKFVVLRQRELAQERERGSHR